MPGAHPPRKHRAAVPRGGYALVCAVCAVPFTARRADAEVCSKRCHEQRRRWRVLDGRVIDGRIADAATDSEPAPWERTLDARVAAEDAASNGLGRSDPRPVRPHTPPQALDGGRWVDSAGVVWTLSRDAQGPYLTNTAGDVRRPWTTLRTDQQLAAWCRVALTRRTTT